MSSKKRIYTFVDNSNIFIEAQKTYMTTKFSSRELALRYRLDFGKLFNLINSSRGDIFFYSDYGPMFPKLYGSEPPKMDSLWQFLKGYGVDVRVFQRNAFNKEKEVDTALVWDASELVFEQRHMPSEKKREGDVIAIAGGDRDFMKIYEEGIKAGFIVEYYSWEDSACNEIKSLPTFHNLTPLIDSIGFLEEDRFEHNFGDTDWSKVVPYK